MLLKRKQERTFLLIGSTNVGKSTYFNRLTWKNSPIGNIERVTTTPFSGNYKRDNSIKFIDLPGINNLSCSSDDEKVSFNHLINSEYEGVINILSVNTLKRDLLLTYDLAEAGKLNLININMIDELNDTEQIKKITLTNEFKVEVNFMSSKKIGDVNNSVLPIIKNTIKNPEPLIIKYDKKIEDYIQAFIKEIDIDLSVSKRFVAIQTIMNNKVIMDLINTTNQNDKLLKLFKKFKINKNDANTILITKQKLVDNLYAKLFINKNQLSTKQQTKSDFYHETKWTRFLDKIFLNKYLAAFIFLLIIALIWFLTFYEYAGGWIQAKLAEDGLGQLQTIINERINSLNDSQLQSWWANFVTDGLLGGVFTILGFIPWIVILTISISILEQIGILSRVCLAFDKIFEPFGLSGRSIVSIITGVGCNIPAILQAKNSNSYKEKVVSIMISPFVSCGARVVVIGFMSQILISQEFTWLFNFGFTIFSVIFALFIAYFCSNILFRRTNSLFIGELVKYHTPDFYIIIKKTVIDVFEFLKRVAVIVFICNFIVWLLSYTAPNSQFYIDVNDPEAIKKSFLRYLSVPLQIIYYPLGIGTYWQLPISLATAFPAKEIAATNIETLFGGIDGFKAIISGNNLTNSIVISYLMLFSFYIPCMATLAVIKKEIGWKFMFINIFISFISSWILSFIVFNISSLFETLNNFKYIELNNIMICVLSILIVIYWFRYNIKNMLLFKTKFNNQKIIKIDNYLRIILISLFMSSIIVTDVFMLLYAN